MGVARGRTRGEEEEEEGSRRQKQDSRLSERPQSRRSSIFIVFIEYFKHQTMPDDSA